MSNPYTSLDKDCTPSDVGLSPFVRYEQSGIAHILLAITPMSGGEPGHYVESSLSAHTYSNDPLTTSTPGESNSPDVSMCLGLLPQCGWAEYCHGLLPDARANDRMSVALGR